MALWTARPRFSWRLAPGINVRQNGYELVIDTADGVAVCRTGRVESAQSVLVACLASDLPSATPFTWRVRVWTAGDETPSPWAESSFETAALGPWTAPWIEPEQQTVLAEGPTTLFEALVPTPPTQPPGERLHPVITIRHRFDIAALPVRARLRATAHGVYQAELNGTPVGDEVLAPGYESYQHALSAQTYDITDHLVPGENVLGILLGDGWYAGRISILGRSAQYGDRLRASWQLELIDAHGRVEIVVPDDTDCVSTLDGPVRWSDLFIGEHHDARAELPGWSAPGFDDTTWTPARRAAAGVPGVPVLPFVGEPVRRVLALPAVAVLTTPAGETVVDFGQVVAGRVRMTVSGPAGTEVVLEHGEVLDAAGNYLNNIIGAHKDQTDTFVLRGDAEGETWEPLFTFHGFRYCRVSGYPGPARPEYFTAVVLSSDLRGTGTWSSSDARLERLHENVMWSQRANFLSVPTDCPQRERAGWTGDAQVFAAAAASNADIALFMDRWLRNVRRDQEADGVIPIIVPMPPAMSGDWAAGDPLAGIRVAAGWGDVITILPLTLWRRYGDVEAVAANYPAMQAWVELQRRQAAEHLPARLADVPLDTARRAQLELLWNGVPNFGDWLAPSTLDHTDPSTFMNAPLRTGELVGAMFGAQSLTLIAEAAHAIHDDAAAADYRARAEHVRAAFAAEYLDEAGLLPVDLQGPYVLALAFEMAPPDRRQPIVDRLVELIHDNGDRLDTGFLSVPHLLDVLWDHGHASLARTLLWQSECPSWLYEVDRGATTVWEAWDAIRPDGTVSTASFNHYAFGCVDDVLYRRIAGLVPAEPGYRASLLTPDLDGPLAHVRAGIETPYGTLAIDWSRPHPDTVTIVATVPPNTSSTVVLPDGWKSSDPTAGLGSGVHTVSASRILVG